MTDEEFAKLFPNVNWPRTFEGKRATHIIPTTPSEDIRKFLESPIDEDRMLSGSFRNYEPTPREKLVDFLNRTLFSDDREGRDRAEFLSRPIDVSPAAIPFAAYDTSRAIGEGRYKDAVAPGVTVAAPFAGKPLKMLFGATRGKGQFKEVIENIARPEREAPSGFPAEANRIGETATGLPSPLPNIGSKTTLAEPPAMVLNKGGIPEQAFLTKGLEKKRHNYPSGGTITDDIGASADATKDRIYAPPNKPQRPFAEDYTNGVRPEQVDAKGNLLVDRRGHPIDSWLTVGRRTLGGDDIGATHQEFRTIGEKLLGRPIETVPRAQIRNRAGRFRYDEDTRKPLSISVADDLNELKRNHVTNHEIAHLIDLETGLPPVPPEVLKELEPVYSTLRTQFDWPLTRPSRHGYKGLEVRNEIVAEGYRAAITNPNFMKSKAPKAYAWLADQIEKSARVRKWLVLNGLGAGAVASFWAFGQKNESAAAEAPAQHSSQANAVRNTRPTFIPATPFEPQDKTANLPAYRFPELVKALAARSSFTQNAKSEEFKGLVRALVNREARRRSQSYGGPK